MLVALELTQGLRLIALGEMHTNERGMRALAKRLGLDRRHRRRHRVAEARLRDEPVGERLERVQPKLAPTLPPRA